MNKRKFKVELEIVVEYPEYSGSPNGWTPYTSIMSCVSEDGVAKLMVDKGTIKELEIKKLESQGE